MKKYIRFALPLLIILFSIAPTTGTQAQLLDAIQEAIRQALMAADVAVQKVQNATLELQNAQKQIENDLSQTSLGDIGDWEKKQKDLYGDYFNELWQVKTIISYFKQITGIIAQQKQLVTEYKDAYARVQQDMHFTAAELTYMYSVYSGIIAQSVKSVDQILMILTSFSLQMSDAARMKIIAKASTDIEKQTSDLRNFNNQTQLISLQRAKDQKDLNTVRSLYGLP